MMGGSPSERGRDIAPHYEVYFKAIKPDAAQLPVDAEQMEAVKHTGPIFAQALFAACSAVAAMQGRAAGEPVNWDQATAANAPAVGSDYTHACHAPSQGSLAQGKSQHPS